MDSLLATYASSDEDDDQPQRRQQPPPCSSSSSYKPTNSLFSSLPPTSHSTPISLPLPNPKKVIQFRPPTIHKPPTNDDSDDDDDDEEIERKKRKQLSHQNTSIKSLLSSIPAPKYSSATPSLGAAPASRRSVIDTESPAPTPPAPIPDAPNVVLDNSYDCNLSYVNYNESYVQPQQYYDGNVGWSDYNNDDNSVLSSGIDSFVGKASGKRRKDQIPVEIMEVKQDELMKNRPTEDKSKLTGMAFGPSYQPASSKGKPAKLHKRKHQIGSLYYDMKQKEGEFQDRRAKGFLTKSETQAKYGW